ncbi:MAG: TFIIB-type zinc ribbon-containing protein [Pyrobaculum sp.]
MSCPKCGSRDLVLTPSGDFLCKSCGYRQPFPQVNYSWAEVEIKRAKLFELYIEEPVEDCATLLSLLSRELDEKDAKILAANILIHKAERRRHLKGLYTEAEKCL